MIISRRPLVVCVLVVGALLLLAGLGAAQSQATLTVTVVDQDGDPVSDVAVSATWDDGDGGPVNETTRANGQALLDVPEGADVTIDVHDDEYVRNSHYVVEDASTGEVTVAVSPSTVPTVTVVDSDGEPLADSRVRLYRSGTFVTDQQTGGEGTVTTRPVEEGDYRLYVGKTGYYQNRTDATFNGEDSATVVIEEGSVLLTFEVLDDNFDDPRPVRNASVTVESVGTVQTLSDGEATITVPVNSWHTAEVTKNGYDTDSEQLRVRESPQSVSLAIQRTPGVEVEPSNQRVVVGEMVRLTVTDEYGEPVENATIGRDGETVARTDASGVATAAVPTAGPVNFTAENGSLSATTTVEGVEAAAAGTETGTVSPTGTSTPTSGDDDGPVSIGGPGFTVLAAVVGVLLAAFLARRRR